MSEIKVNSIKGVGASAAAITVNNTDGTCTANITNNLSNRRLTINGDMKISQRGTSFNQAADADYTLDRFGVFRNGAGIMDIEQSTTVPAGEGFKNSLKCTVDTADSSIGGTDFGGLFHKIEGQDIKQLEFGNSSAKQFTLSFFVRSNITGTYSVSFRNGSANRYLVKEYTISSADTWQKITITDTADLTGTWASDNTTGLQINWCLWEGGFTAAPNTWGTGNVVGSTNNVNWVATVGNTFYLTGVQFEQNSVATDFEHLSVAEELRRCQRYFAKYSSIGSNYAQFLLTTGYSTDTDSRGMFHFVVEMRAANPSFSYSGSSGNVSDFVDMGGKAINLFQITNDGTGKNTGIRCIFSGSNTSAGFSHVIRANNTANAFFAFDAEL